MTSRSAFVRLMMCTLALSSPAALSAQEHEHGPASGEKLGSVAFPTSCTPGVQEEFERGVAMLHSFWFPQAEAAFRDVAEADPACAMAWWGLAMTLWGNPMARMAPSPDNAARALAAAERAALLAASATERERRYAAAALALYREQETVGHLERMRRHEEALRRVHEAHPDDDEATIFYARAVVADASPNDLTFERQLYAASLLEPLFLARPDHPGIAHYLIHAFDAPAIADKGLEAARLYAEIAPSAPHALHMPSHIFTRLGYWDESIATNRRSADLQENPDAAAHPLDYMVYAYLQEGRDDEAAKVVGRAVRATAIYEQGVAEYNLAAMPARLALERDRWEEAAALSLPHEAPPHVEAITRFARAVGAARSGHPEAAGGDLARLAELVAALRQKDDAYWATVVEAQRMAASAWAARAAGEDAEALRLAEAAAELEETVEKHPVTPGPLLPARELFGDMLLAQGRPVEAREAYERTLAHEPRRARSLFGAARAAELAGETEAASGRYRELVALLDPASTRPELAHAREFLTRAAATRGR